MNNSASLRRKLIDYKRRPASDPDAFLLEEPSRECPIVRLSPARAGGSLADTVESQRDLIESIVLRDGAIVFRGFAELMDEEIKSTAIKLCGSVVDYTERSTPRSQLGDQVYSATEYPAHQRIDLHNENSYASEWPDALFFWCVQPADRGGESLLADSRRVLNDIPLRTREVFAFNRILYRRELGPPLGLSWRYVFQSEDKDEVQTLCRDRGYQVVWHDQDRLSISRVSDAVRVHPRTGEEVWFNHAAFFHEACLDDQIRSGMRVLYGNEYLPNRSFFGDGADIAPETIAEVVSAYRRNMFAVKLRANDVLMLDNMLMAHGRNPFKGTRDLRLVMAAR